MIADLLHNRVTWHKGLLSNQVMNSSKHNLQRQLSAKFVQFKQRFYKEQKQAKKIRKSCIYRLSKAVTSTPQGNAVKVAVAISLNC